MEMGANKYSFFFIFKGQSTGVHQPVEGGSPVFLCNRGRGQADPPEGTPVLLRVPCPLNKFYSL